MERTEWPTPGKLRELRDAGVVHYSPGATACLVAATVCFVLRAGSADVVAAFERFRGAIVFGDVGRALSGLLGVAGLWCAVGVGCVGLVVAASIVVQTRFLFRPGRLGVQLDRLWVGGAGSLTAPLRRGGGMLGYLTLGVICSVALVSLWSRDMAALLNHGVDYLLERARERIDVVCAVGGGLLMLVALPVWGVSRGRFLFEHRMSRAEVLRDQRQE